MVVTRMKFDTTAESPKLVFSPQRWLTEGEYETAKDKGQAVEAQRAVMMTAAAADGAKPAPMVLEGKRPDAVEETVEEEAPKAKKKAAAPVATEDDEPEVRKPAAKETAVPAKKSKLADIVADWDDE
jgi:hypothetical protein